jgi:hypothetical protein
MMFFCHFRRLFCLVCRTAIILALSAGLLPPAGAQTVITVDPSAGRHAISPLIYGVCFGSEAQLKALNFTVNRQGGNNFTRYNWKNNTLNNDADWYFESIPASDLTPGANTDQFIRDTKAAGAQPMISISMIGWVAKVTDPKKKLYSFSVAKYGPQQKTDPYLPDAGNGIRPDGSRITNNDPNDASVPIESAYQKEWIQHIVGKWKSSVSGGVRYYIMDNEPGLWHSTHADVCPFGPTYDEYLKDFLDYATMVKSVDPEAKVAGFEAWGWPELASSGADELYQSEHNWQGHPDMDAHGGMDYTPWLLQQIHKHDVATGHRLLDLFTFHIYPQGGESGTDNSSAIENLRNRSTRSFWDPNYVDESWIKNRVMMIPRMKALVAQYYPGTKIGLTEYNWGGENTINGATAQADILGIFGREGLDLATRWTVPDPSTPTFKAMQMYRNYDGHDSVFGDIGVSDTVPNPDDLSSFAAFRTSDRALTIMVINKSLDHAANIDLGIAHRTGNQKVDAWQLTAANVIQHIAPMSCVGGHITGTLPVQSVTMMIVPR